MNLGSLFLLVPYLMLGKILNLRWMAPSELHTLGKTLDWSYRFTFVLTVGKVLF